MRTLSLSFLVLAWGLSATGGTDDVANESARRLHTRALVVDTHDDTPQRMVYQ
jgi:hypothetical protein